MRRCKAPGVFPTTQHTPRLYSCWGGVELRGRLGDERESTDVLTRWARSVGALSWVEVVRGKAMCYTRERGSENNILRMEKVNMPCPGPYTITTIAGFERWKVLKKSRKGDQRTQEFWISLKKVEEIGAPRISSVETTAAEDGVTLV